MPNEKSFNGRIKCGFCTPNEFLFIGIWHVLILKLKAWEPILSWFEEANPIYSP